MCIRDSPFLVDRRDRIILGPFTDDDLQPGVAVLARDTNGRIIFHRIIHRNGHELTLLGDGNIRITEQTNIANVMGCLLYTSTSNFVSTRSWEFVDRKLTSCQQTPNFL